MQRWTSNSTKSPLRLSAKFRCFAERCFRQGQYHNRATRQVLFSWNDAWTDEWNARQISNRERLTSTKQARSPRRTSAKSRKVPRTWSHVQAVWTRKAKAGGRDSLVLQETRRTSRILSNVWTRKNGRTTSSNGSGAESGQTRGCFTADTKRKSFLRISLWRSKCFKQEDRGWIDCCQNSFGGKPEIS